MTDAQHEETARRPTGWPSDKPVWSVAVFLLAALVVPGRIAFEYAEHWNELGTFYFPHYVASGAPWSAGVRRCRLLETVTRRSVHLTASREVEPVPGGFRLTPAAVERGALALRWQRVEVDSAKLHEFLRSEVYGARPAGELMKDGALWACALLLNGLLVAVPMDRRAQRMYREGRLVRGPVVVTRDVFNRKRKRGGRTDGIGFVTREPQSLRERWLIQYAYGPRVAIPREDEAKQFLIVGNTGTGKSAAMMQLAVQIADRDEAAIVYDPALEYVRRFYRRERGDLILNPLDARSPYWSPGEEVEHDAEALTIAHALFPDRPNESPFFLEGARKLLAHLLRFHPTPGELVAWMSNESEIDRRVQGTAYASLIDARAPQQREGVLASMNLVADTVRLLKGEADGAGRWTAREWKDTRQGWIFLTSTPETRDALKPLISLWLDLLILRLLNEPDAGARRVWFLLDELGSLQKLPQLVTALTENRKSDNPVVMGIQGKAQLETIYGHIAETMLSMPWTALFFKTTEPNAADWISRYLGRQEIERVRVSRAVTPGAGVPFGPGAAHRETKTYAIERTERYPVMPSEVGGLEALRGYLKSGNYIVPLTIDYWDLPRRAEGFVARELPAMFPVRLEAAAEANGGPSRKLERKRQQGQGRRFFD
jgi:hypothetical protein